MTVGGTDVNVTDWTLTLAAVLEENTPITASGNKSWAAVAYEGSGSANAPWDSEQVPDTDISLGPGDTGTMRLYCGDSTKFFSFGFIVESLVMLTNAQNDIVRYSVNFKTTGAITHPVT